ncbi:MAG: hypothetical protein J6W75_01500 [Bacteroidaceae bacterium]|nr:hypothetical protein [Bacteroidaceae bacterium]
MKKSFLLLLALWMMATLHAATLTANQEYYIWLNIYEKLLGNNEAGDAPALSAFAKNDAGTYVFVAENSGKSGYVLLRQKVSGRYLAASSSNSYSVVFENARSTEDRFCWKVDESVYTYLVNKKNGKYLGVDGANKGSAYVSVYYDKPKGSHSQFSAIPANGSTWDEARAAFVSEVYTNEQGVREIDYCLMKNLQIDRDDAIDIHVSANDKPIQGTTKINLGSDRTWLIIDNLTPSDVVSNYLKYVTIEGKRASNNSNCRVAIFLNGAAVIPIPKAPMTCQGTDGEFTLAVANHADLSKRSNTMTSFTLRRGYMATVASGTKGSGHSRVYVADHADLEVVLPKALAKRVSSVFIKPWQYLSKKGWGNTSGTSGADQLRATWFWSWSAGYSSTTNLEYVPCRQHLYWPSASDVNNKTASASLSLNEPEHSEQHTNQQCSCGGTINAWTAYTINKDFLPGGGRIGSPQPTELSYLTEFCGHVDDMASRCDFAVTHAYWDLAGYNETDYANWFCDTKCKSVWNNTGRPLWLTEMEISASWNSNKVTSYEQNRKYLQVLLQKLEESPWVERYCIYGVDMWQTAMFYEYNPSKGLTPAGQVYRDHRSTFAYNSKYTKTPTWWAPSAKVPALKVKTNTNGTISFTITNPNQDMTDELYVEKLGADGRWTEIARMEDRSKLESQTVSITGVSGEGLDLENDHFRVVVITLTGATVYSGDARGLLVNPSIETNSKTTVEGWTCTKEAQNGFTKEASGDTYLEVWDPNAAQIQFDYYQELSDLDNGLYRLTANVFNSTNRVEGATVNGAVGLYAQTTDQLYFSPVTEDSELDTTRVNIIDQIVVTDGKLRVGIRNLGTMSARWAGGDNFLLVRTGDLKGADLNAAHVEADYALYDLMPFTGEDASSRDATRFIVNPDCNRKNSYGWTTKNVEYKTDAEAYDGDASNSYWNIWKSGSFSSSMSQEIPHLPEGTYAFSALLRGQNTATMTLTASTPTASASKSFQGIGNVSPEGAAYPQGWQLVTTEPVQVGKGEVLTLKLDVEASATAWWSVDHFALTLTSIPEGHTDVRLPSAMQLVDDNTIYDLSGRPVPYPAVRSGVFIVRGRKVFFK